MLNHTPIIQAPEIYNYLRDYNKKRGLIRVNFYWNVHLPVKKSQNIGAGKTLISDILVPLT